MSKRAPMRLEESTDMSAGWRWIDGRAGLARRRARASIGPFRTADVAEPRFVPHCLRRALHELEATQPDVDFFEQLAVHADQICDDAGDEQEEARSEQERGEDDGLNLSAALAD